MKLTLILLIALCHFARRADAKRRRVRLRHLQRAADELSLSQSQASRFARLALKCVSKEYPNKPDHVINNAADVEAPKNLHPAFYGCYDWHSSVHGHWMLVRLIRTFPAVPEAPEIRNALGANLSKDEHPRRGRLLETA